MRSRGPQAAPDGVPHPPRRRDLGVGDLGRERGTGPACPAGDVGRQGGGERRLGLLEGQEPGGQVPALGLGEPGADRAEVLQPVRPRRPGQDRPRQLGAGAGPREPAADEDVGGGQVADLQPVTATLSRLVRRGKPLQDDALEAEFAAGVGGREPGRGRRAAR